MVYSFKYNGKEFDSKNGLNWYDYGARHYDATLGRWHVADPLADKYYGYSPYTYCYNNLLKYINPDGKREWPVNESYKGFGRRHENNFGAPRNRARNHEGVDINHTGGGNSDLGAPILATHDGTVTRVARIANGDTNPGGNRVSITSEDGVVTTSYMHLDEINEGIVVGSVITEGQQIGTMGGTGQGQKSKYSSHLHYEIKVNGKIINPAKDAISLIDPQALISPKDGGELPEVEISGRKLDKMKPVKGW